jgi:hypothetical protein
VDNTRSKRPRQLKAREPITTTPLYVSQHTACALAGFKTPDGFLEFVRVHKVDHTRLGKTVLVEVGVLQEVLRRLSSAEAEGPGLAKCEGDEPETADQILAALGVRRSA